MVLMEDKLRRAVVVVVERVGPGFELSMDTVASAIHHAFHISRLAFSIRAYEPEDFLLLCASFDVMDQLVVSARLVSPQFTLRFSQWSRLAHAQLGEVPERVNLELRGIPSHAWEQRTADMLIEGCGIHGSVDAATANWDDMSCFRLSMWTHNVECIPTARWLAVPEPGAEMRLVVSTARRRPSAIAPKVLWYRVRFWVAGICRDDSLLPSDPSSGPRSPPDEQAGGNVGIVKATARRFLAPMAKTHAKRTPARSVMRWCRRRPPR
jgi:hypothetical protein